MRETLPENPITSKQLLAITGISRATLNNYIKMGIIPRPFVAKPSGDLKGIKKIGYFPRTVLDRIELVRHLKQEGKSMEEISLQLKCTPDIEGHNGSGAAVYEERPENDKDIRIEEKELVLTFKDLPQPAYLLDFDFRVEWTNQLAEQIIFRQCVGRIKDRDSKNIFRLFFHWEFHNHVRNWRDLIAFHMSFARLKYSRTWMKNMYEGISTPEVKILEDIYDRVKPLAGKAVRDTPINLLKWDGSTENLQGVQYIIR